MTIEAPPPAGSYQLIGAAKVAGWRETSQTSPTGVIQQGIAFAVQVASGNIVTVFVPNTLLGQTDAVAAAINERLAAIQSIEALS